MNTCRMSTRIKNQIKNNTGSGNVVKNIPTEMLRTSIYESGIYNPDFKRTHSPSIERCVEAAIAESRNSIFDLNRNFRIIMARWRGKKGFSMSSYNHVGQVVSEHMSEIKYLDEIIELLVKPPKCLKRRQQGFFRELVSCYLDHHYKLDYWRFAIDATPCFFEQDDLNLRKLTLFCDSDFFTKNEKYSDIESRYAYLRAARLDQGEEQKVEAKIYIDNGMNIDLKYFVINRQDKLDVVVRVNEDGLKLKHYHIGRYTRRNGESPMVSYEIKQSSKTGDFVIKTESEGQSGLFHRNRNQMEASNFFKFISKNPIFLGGNGFLYVADFIRSNREKILNSSHR